MKPIINSTNSVPEPGKRTKRKGYIKKWRFLELLSHKYYGLGVVTSVKHNAPTGKYDPDGTPKMKVISLIYLTPNDLPTSVNPSTRRGDIHIGTWQKGYGWEFPCDWDLAKRLRMGVSL